MKSRFLFSLLILAVIGLIVLSAKLTTRFFDLSSALEKPKAEKVAEEKPDPIKENPAPVLAKTVINATEPVLQSPVKRRPPPILNPSKTNESEKTTSVQPAKKEKKIEAEIPEKISRPGIGTVTEVNGQVFGSQGDKSRRRLIIHSRVHLNETIETGTQSKIVITFDDKSTISQGENSSIIIDTYIYDPNDKKKNAFGMRLIKGFCRVVTGVITEINPKRFHVKTRMATIGIRGCELAFRTSREKDDIYIIGLSGERTIQIEASKTGKHITNVHTGKPIPKGRVDLITFNVARPNQLVSVISGRGRDQRPMSPSDFREMVEESTKLAPAAYEVQNTSKGAVFLLKPELAKPNND